jgi:hypothetical protein
MNSLLESPKAERPDLKAVFCRERLGMPESWRIFLYRCLPEGARDSTHYAFKGAICTAKFVRGRRAGETNWDKMDRTSVREVIVSIREFECWLLEWERRTGLCHECAGTKQVVQSVSVDHGAIFKTCPRCDGCGKAP